MTAGDKSLAPADAAVTGTDPSSGTGDPDAVYDPAEDSVLLTEAAVERASVGDTVVDIGTGSGVIAARVRAATGARVVGVDLNPHACRVARARSRPGVPAGDGTPLPVVRGDLTGPIREGVADLVTFNPPYLPDSAGAGGSDPSPEGLTELNAEANPDAADDWLRTAYAGGDSGRAVIAPFLDAVDRVLAPGGRILLLVSTLTGIDDVRELASTAGYSVERVAEEPIPFETLVVLDLVVD